MAKPILDVFCIEEDGCKYPVAVRLLMDDHTVQTYTLLNRVEPQFTKLKESIEISIGYQYTPKHKRKNRIHRCDR